MAYQFYVVMQKRGDLKVYADVHKTNGIMYYTEEEALDALNSDAYKEVRNFFHVVPLVAMTLEEYQDGR